MKYSIEITGSALSFLYYVTSSGAKEGFLLGKIEESQEEIISDAHESSVKKNMIIRISGVFPYTHISQQCPYVCPLLEEDVYKTVTSKQGDSKIVGWFYCRRNCMFKPSFRETDLHAKLSSRYSKDNTKKFVFVLVQDGINQLSITREFQSKFFQYDDSLRKWFPLLGSVMNWHHRSSSNSSKSIYRSLPTLEPGLLEKFAKQPRKQGLQNVELIEGIIDNAQSYMEEALQRIVKINSEISRVKLEITRLESKSSTNRHNKDPSEADGESNNDEDDIFGSECFPDEPTSPLITIRRKQSLRCSQILSDDEATTSAEVSALHSSGRNSGKSKSNYRSKTSSQEY